MQTNFPTQIGYQSFFLVGFRRDPVTTAVQRLGTVIVKRTYEIDPQERRVWPTDAMEILMKDEVDPHQAAIVRYEHDLAPFKPHGDICVLDYLDVSNRHGRVVINGMQVLTRKHTDYASSFDSATADEDKDWDALTHLFGWESRAAADSGRKVDGAFPEAKSAYPLPEALPTGFNNRFYNSYRRLAAASSPPRYLSPGAEVEIYRGTTSPYQFNLNREKVMITVYTAREEVADIRANWNAHPVGANLDTLVIEPQANRCYVLWRGIWPFAAHLEDAYRLLDVQASA